jgi:hypothetical protein
MDVLEHSYQSCIDSTPNQVPDTVQDPEGQAKH